MRLRAFPFPASVKDFLDQHSTVFVVEQNRDAQMHALLVNDVSVAHASYYRPPMKFRNRDGFLGLPLGPGAPLVYPAG